MGMNEEGAGRGEILFKQESYAILGACFEVYKDKGCGFLESVYQECLQLELAFRNIPFKAQLKLGLSYKGNLLTQTYEPDFVCYEKIIVELKSVVELTDKHRVQVHNYLKATDMHLGLLVNFGHYPGVEYERIVR